MSKQAVASLVGGATVLILGVWAVTTIPGLPTMLGLAGRQAPVPHTSTPIDAATLAGHPGLFYLDAGNLTGTIDNARFSAYSNLEAEGKIDKGATIITDQNLPPAPPVATPNPGTITGVQTGLGLMGGGTAGPVTVALNPGVGLTFSNGQLVATLGTSIDLNSDEAVSVLPVAKGGTGLSQLPQAGAVLVGTGTGYTYGLLSDGDGTKLINASGQLNYSVDSTVCRTSGNCAGAGGGITGTGTPNHLARFSSTGTLADSTLYDTGSAIGIGTTNPQAMLDISSTAHTFTGPELVANGSFDNGSSGWSLSTCASVVGGQLVMTYVDYATCGDDRASVTFNSVSGITYQITLDVVTESNDQVDVWTDQSDVYSGAFGSGTQTFTYTSSFTGVETLYVEGWNWNDASSWTIDNVSVKQSGSQALTVDGDTDLTGNLSLNGTGYVSGNLNVGNGYLGQGVLSVGADGTAGGYSKAAIDGHLVIRTPAAATTQYTGVSSNVTVASLNSSAVSTVRGLGGFVENDGSGTVSEVDGLYYSGLNYGASVNFLTGANISAGTYAGTTNQLAGLQVSSQASNASATTQYGLTVTAYMSGTATVANRYGLYIGSMAGTTSTSNDFALYSVPSQKSYLAGSLGLGTTSPKSKLDVNGGLAVGTYAGVTAAPSNGLIVSGNVGIGTGSPAYALDVYSKAGGSVARLRSSGANNASLTIDNQAGGNQSSIVFADAGATKYQIGKQTDNSFFLWDGTNARMALSYSPTTTSLALQPSGGNVGIGMSAPSHTLDVAGTGHFSGALSVTGTYGTTTLDGHELLLTRSALNYIAATDPAGGLSFRTGGIIDRLTITSAGNVGIGTTSPAFAWDVLSSGGSVARLRSSGANPATLYVDNAAGGNQSSLVLSDAGAAKYQVGKQTDNTFFMYDAANARSFLTYNPGTNTLGLQPTSGNVGLGTSNPQAKLQIAGGSILLDNSRYVGFYDNGGVARQALTYTSGNNMELINGAATGALQLINQNDVGPIAFYTGSGITERMRISPTGNVGIGTSNPTAKLSLLADTTAAGGIAFGTDTNLYRSATNTLNTDSLFSTKGGLVIGSGGAQISRFLSATTLWTPPSLNTGSAITTTVAVANAAVGDTVTVSFSQPLPDNVLISGSVSAVGTVKVVLFNASGSTVSLAAGTLRADVWQH